MPGAFQRHHRFSYPNAEQRLRQRDAARPGFWQWCCEGMTKKFADQRAGQSTKGKPGFWERWWHDRLVENFANERARQSTGKRVRWNDGGQLNPEPDDHWEFWTERNHEVGWEEEEESVKYVTHVSGDVMWRCTTPREGFFAVESVPAKDSTQSDAPSEARASLDGSSLLSRVEVARDGLSSRV